MIVKWIKNNGHWILLVIILVAVTLIRCRLLDIPLERDEGEYAYMGQLILQGIPPYETAHNMKFPGTYYIYAFFMAIFGQTTAGVHLGLLVTNLFSIVLLFFLVKKLMGHYAAMVASAVYALLSVSAAFCGFASHATHFVVLPTLAGTILLYKAKNGNKKKHYILSGLLLGLAPIMKQPGCFFFLFGLVFLALQFFMDRKVSTRAYIARLALFIVSGMLPFALLLLMVKWYGVMDKFWFWTFEYASNYASQVSANEIFPQFRIMFAYLFKDLYLIWIFAGLGVIALFFHPNLGRNSKKLFIILFLLFSILSVCPGFYFREHYFITLLPVLSILFGVAPDFLRTLSGEYKKLRYLEYASYGLVIIPIATSVIMQRDYLFKTSPEKISRNLYWFNPFVESPEIARYIREHSEKADKICILGSEPQIFFYANRHSATGYIYTYSLMEIHKYSLDMQEEMIREIEASLPSHFIYVHIATSWLAHEDSQTRIFEWINPYLHQNNFHPVGVVDLLPNKTLYKWNEEAIDYEPISDHFIQIFERKR